ncbi:MAG: leucine-rich repeat domain-containing protein [Candidatus Fimenecus sp.]
MAKKMTAVLLVLVLGLSVLFCGCSTDTILNALSIDTDTYDPATEMVAEVLGKTVSQEGLTSGEFTYLVFSDGTAAVTAWSGKGGVLTIPESIDGHTVIALENKALYKAQMTELVLPDTLEVVGNYAAMYCDKLEKVTFGKNIRNIGVSAFESVGDNTSSTGAGSLKTIVWNGAPEVIRVKAFYYADKLTEIVLPAGVKTIENWAFAKCFSADKIILGEGLEVIGDHAFLKCHAAKEISIPGTCKTVETSAFYQCVSAEKLTIGEGVETLQKGAFEECSSLKDVTVPDSVQTMEPYIFYNCTSLETCKMGSPATMEKDIFTGESGVTVTAPAGSTAENYAAEYGLAFTAA